MGTQEKGKVGEKRGKGRERKGRGRRKRVEKEGTLLTPPGLTTYSVFFHGHASRPEAAYIVIHFGGAHSSCFGKLARSYAGIAAGNLVELRRAA